MHWLGNNALTLAAFDPFSKQPELKHAAIRVERIRGRSPNSSPALCACLNVGEDAVRAAVAAGASLPQLQAELKCGTQCGTCVPELRLAVTAGTLPASPGP